MAMDGFPMPPNYNPPFAIITDDDHSGYLIIACALGISLVSLSIIIRVLLRSMFGHGFGTDDTVLFIATVSWRLCTSNTEFEADVPSQAFAFIESALIWTAAGKGLGASLDLMRPSDIQTIEKLSTARHCANDVLADILQMFYASHILTIITLALAKCSVGFFILRLTPHQFQRVPIWSTIAVTAAWMVASVLAMALQCDLSQPWRLTRGVQCPDSVSRFALPVSYIQLTGKSVYSAFDDQHF